MKRFYPLLKYAWVVALAMAMVLPTNASTRDDARKLYKAGKYAEAAPLFKSVLKSKPNDGSVNHWYGVCLFHEKNYTEAEKYLKVGVKRKVLESSHYLAKVYTAQYRFDDAIAAYEDYKELLKKEKKNIPETIDQTLARLRRAKLMLQNIERVQIIDSVIVDANSFFTHYKITPETGRIGTKETLGVAIPEGVIGYIPQRGDRVFFSVKSAENGLELNTQNKLTDGKWSETIALPEGVNTPADEAYPFFLNDGVTLYFASNGEGSIGGYDLFVSRQNLESNTFLKPENMGMPFNSIYNDYMIVIDEMLNVGWFVSDREQIPGKLTIYLFIPNESKLTYNPNEVTTDLASLALIRSIRDSWPEDANYTGLLTQIKNIKEETEVERPDFLFAICNGRHYTKLDQFVNPEARNLYIKATEIRKKIERTETHLSNLRTRYNRAKGNTRQQLATKIKKVEKELLDLYPQPDIYENQARQAEQKALKKK